MTHLSILDSALLLLLLLLILLALLLLVPIDLEGRVSRGGDRPETRMKIGWLFGLLQKDMSRSAVEQGPSENEEEKKGKEKDTKVGPGSSRIALEVLRTEGFLRNLTHLLRGLVRALRVQFLWIDIRLGLSDPAETAEVVGLLWAVLIPLEALTPLRARIVPCFSEETLEGSVEGKLRIWPYKTVPPMIRFLLSPPTWRAGLKAISMKRGKR
ncbi:MAG TPA: DUF2953 domain-containing protein [Methanotrichaceae archaeon]|nr:DUF2953 domain-containing protein [Methanotrichaceae archaeon]